MCTCQDPDNVMSAFAGKVEDIVSTFSSFTVEQQNHVLRELLGRCKVSEKLQCRHGSQYPG